MAVNIRWRAISDTRAGCQRGPRLVWPKRRVFDKNLIWRKTGPFRSLARSCGIGRLGKGGLVRGDGEGDWATWWRAMGGGGMARECPVARVAWLWGRVNGSGGGIIHPVALAGAGGPRFRDGMGASWAKENRPKLAQRAAGRCS